MARRFLLRLVAMCACIAPATAHASPTGPDKNAVGNTLVLRPTTLTKLDDLDFAFLSVTTAGTAVLNSTTDTITTTGGVLFAGGTPHAARFVATSPNRAVVRIQLPNRPTTLTRVGGTETMTLDTWNIDGATTRTVVAKEQFEFKVGGTLHVNANQVEGTYVGTFDVSVNYN